jgi:hypothetical protein
MMKNHPEWKTYHNQSLIAHSPARTIAAVTNPCILSIVMLICIAFTRASQLSTALTQAAVLVGLFVILPLVYVFFRTKSDPEKGTFRTDPTFFLKRHPRDVMILGIICGPSSWAILKIVDAPAPLLETLLALLITAFLAAIINLFYRISFHLSAIMVLIYMAAVIWGPFFWISLLAVPPIGWAKYRLHDHNLLQLGLGIILGMVVTLLVVQVGM